MLYRLRIDRDVVQQIEELPGHVRQRVVRLIDGLRTEPRPPTAKSLRGNHADKLQISLDVWRIVYRVEDEVVTVAVLRVGKNTVPSFTMG